MVDKNYWFEKEEYDRRLARVQAQLVAQGHDALLAFMPESVTWLTGFFTRAYSSFQFAIIPASGAPTVVCRDVEAYYLDSTCCYPDRVMWRDSDDKNAIAVNAIRTRLGEAPSVAVEMAAWPLTVARFNAICAGLPRARFAEAGPLVTQMRFIKSAAEIAYQRGAGGRGGYAGRYRLSPGRRE
ncbi:aminopeptidase P family N-terminal domain-containing protein [Sodalis praecaptivus]|uniref:aminopeptidase P family N-terminal domain-containing protein n=1 Tax=Sodalis praecaptivus TaxID=1239307 RepID=UPI0027F3937A|nr:aminopeptidase P family N-terminal domain-containing protein [Sodalis praecaptivus]CAJ0996274.1 Ectoine hydrolase [Sodalis praecaptivus]